MAEYRIDDLARAAGMTTRNVRAYQERGLLPPPRRSGRVGLYDSAHLARLKLIASMLERGYTSAHIAEMLSAWQGGKNLADVLGVEEELIGPRTADRPMPMSPAQARELAGGASGLERLVGLGLAERHGRQVIVLRPALVAGYAQMAEHGLPMDAVLDLHESIQAPLEEVAARLVEAAARHFATTKGPAWVPDAEEMAQLVGVLARFRQLGMAAVTSTLERSLQHAIERVLGAHIAHLADPPPP